MYRRLVRGDALLQDATAYAFPIVVGASMFVSWATARPGVARERVEAAVFEQYAALADVTDADVERAKNLIEARHLTDLQRVDERADQFSMYTTLFGDPARINTDVDRLRAVSPADVRRFAAEFFTAANRAVLWYVPRTGAGE
jgi:zinc protease